MPKTEAQKASNRAYAKRTYWADPERVREKANTAQKATRAANRAAGIKPKPRAPLTEEAKEKARRHARQKYWADPRAARDRVSRQAKAKRDLDPDAVRSAKRARYARDPHRVLASQRAYIDRERESYRAAWRGRINPVANRDRVHQWARANPDKVREAKLRRRAREAGAAVVDFTVEQWHALLEEFDYRCAYCSAPATTRDHLTPLCRGGWHTASNIVPACRSCNSRKGRQTLLEFAVIETTINLGLLRHSWNGGLAA